MHIDPARNVVVFQFGRDGYGRAAADAPTRDEDCVRQAWVAVQREHGARPEDVVALHSEWEPSGTDSFFIERMFPGASVFYTFERPRAGGWERALDEARRAMAATAGRKRSGEPDDAELLPVLWSASSPWVGLLGATPHRTVVADRMYVGLALAQPRPGGGVGLNHVTHHQQRSVLGDVPFAELLARAHATLAEGLGIDVHSTEDGDQLLALHRDGAPIAGAVTLPDFHRQMSDIIGAPRLVVGLHCPQEMVVAAADSALAGQVERMVLSSTYADSELVPSVLLVEPGGIRLVTERSWSGS